MEILSVPQGRFHLCRYPARKKETLRAWDAADEYLLNYFSENLQDTPVDKLLILNDSFGALATVLSAYQPFSLSDSFLAHAGTRENLQRNQLDKDSVRLLTSLETPPDNARLDVVLIKVPKNLSYLEDQLQRIRPYLHSGSKILASGMVKHIYSSTLKVFEKQLGTTTTSLAKKKARLIFTDIEDTAPTDTPYPKHYTLENTHFSICNHSNVFSRESLDIGTRFFLEHIPSSSQPKTILDLGCGNGIVGLIAAERNTKSDLIFTDESFMAVSSAQETFRHAFSASRKADFIATNCLDGLEKNSVDLIFNNPPFHQGNTIGDHIALQMFKDSKRILKDGGEIWVIGNRHLGYHVKLKKIFGNSDVIASNSKFVILKAKKGEES